jgi:hypothetical protein
MEKLVYLLWKRDGDAIESFRDRLVGDVGRTLIDKGALALTVNVSDLREQVGNAPSLYLGEGKTIGACVSLWLDSLDTRTPLEAALGAISARLDGYLVTESMPLRCPDRDWPDGSRSPGVTLWTAFPKPARVSDEQVLPALARLAHAAVVRDPSAVGVHTQRRRTRDHARGAAAPRHRRRAVSHRRGADRSDEVLRFGRQHPARIDRHRDVLRPRIDEHRADERVDPQELLRCSRSTSSHSTRSPVRRHRRAH